MRRLRFCRAACRRLLLCALLLSLAAPAFAGEDPAALLPKVSLSGELDGISKNHRVLLDFAYTGNEADPLSFTCFAYTTWQGHSTLESEKKNYTIRLFNDEGLTLKHRLMFRPGWQMEHKYILKANYADVTQARNLCAAQVWREMAETRNGVPQRLLDTSNCGAVAGFPVTLWINGSFQGLYTLNLHKDDDLYAMREGRRDAVMICNGQTKPESLFLEEAVFDKEHADWEIEFCGTMEDDLWIREKMNRFIRFVMDADEAEFRERLGDCADVDALVDYYLFIVALGLNGSAAKDLILLSYDDSPWIASVYDMEGAFGLLPDGSAASSPSAFLPEERGGVWSSGTGSLLWDRLLRSFPERLGARYRQLRAGPLSEARLLDIVVSYTDSIPEALIRMDLALYPGRQALAEPVEQMLAYIPARLALLDQRMEALAPAGVQGADSPAGSGS